MYLQDLITKLNEFWSSYGVLIGQPYGLEVAAGTANPHTFFRVLGPEPFNVAYVEPCRRPADGMYGQNPNRLQYYFQYQVILKPAPRFNTYLYMDMLKHLGINPKDHDIRFIEDNWESPSLGAWGVGWEIWLDGMEITQYTYFQQVGGVDLEVPALEITLGLERLAMYLQGVDHYKDIMWNEHVTYEQLFTQHEYYQSLYNYKTASIKRLKTLYNTYYKEALAQLKKKNYWAAYDNMLKMSHVFNILDARGVITYNERVRRFKEMASIVKQVALLYLKERKQQNYPLKNTPPVEYTPTTVEFRDLLNKKDKKSLKELEEKTKSTYVLELGFEELPVDYLSDLSKVFSKSFINSVLAEYGVSNKDIEIMITPQRIGFVVPDITKIVKRTRKITGPTKAVSYTKEGKPTQALKGFMKRYNLKEVDITWVERSGKQVAEVTLTEQIRLEDIINDIIDRFLKLIQVKHARWGSTQHTFIRPLRWIFSFLNNTPIKVEALGVTAENFTMAPRHFDSLRINLYSAAEYLYFLKKFNIYPAPEQRQKLIVDVVSTYVPKKSINKSVVEENVFITESPVPVVEQLPSKYTKLVYELIDAILRVNQRFITFKKQGDIFYTIVINKSKKQLEASKVRDRIVRGYFKVAQARLEDGLFYYNRDLKTDLKEYRDQLKHIPFSALGGSLFNKVERVEKIVRSLLGDVEDSTATTVFELFKNDLATYLGREYPELEGIIGSAYAKEQGYKHSVYTVLRDYVRTKPKTGLGYLLAVADQVDSIVVLAQEVNIAKLSTKDPYHIRKRIRRLIELLLIDNKQSVKLDLKELVSLALEVAKKSGLRVEYSVEEIYSLILRRLEQYWVAKYQNTALVRGVVYNSNTNLRKKLQTLEEFLGLSPDKLSNLLKTFKRVWNILKDQTVPSTVDPQLLTLSYEKKLYNYINKLQAKPILEVRDIVELSKILEKFFETVFVLDPDQKLRNNRLALLGLLQRQLGRMLNLELMW